MTSGRIWANCSNPLSLSFPVYKLQMVALSFLSHLCGLNELIYVILHVDWQDSIIISHYFFPFIFFYYNCHCALRKSIGEGHKENGERI